MIKYYKKVGSQFESVAADQADWINIEPPYDHNEIEQLAAKFNIPLDLLTDSLDIDERSRYEKEDNLKFLLINTPVLNHEKGENGPIYITAPIGIILIDEKIITICSVDNPILNRFEKGYVKVSDAVNEVAFVLKILQQSVFEFLKCLKKLNLRRTLIERELYNSSRNKELQQLLRIEKSLVYFVGSISDNDLLNRKIKRVDFLGIRNDENLVDLFEDILIDNGQAFEMANVHTNILSSTMEAYASIISNNMNVFIQRLTVITIILMVPTLIASFYGMNLKHLPLQDHPLAFYFIILISILGGLALVWFFGRRRDSL
ncbi:MAG: magnesium transporter CorA family protein [Saprospiraceae bacterium]